MGAINVVLAIVVTILAIWIFTLYWAVLSTKEDFEETAQRRLETNQELEKQLVSTLAELSVAKQAVSALELQQHEAPKVHKARSGAQVRRLMEEAASRETEEGKDVSDSK